MVLKNHFPLKDTRDPWGMARYRFGTGNVKDEPEHIPSESKVVIEDHWGVCKGLGSQPKEASTAKEGQFEI